MSIPDTWYDEHNISCWLNTQVKDIELESRKVILGMEETLEYDRLILAMGSSSFTPPIEGFGVKGTYTLREADDAMQIRDFVQRHKSYHAVIAGGGLLGIEAGYALHKLGLNVSVLERGQWPLQRQLDFRGGQFLKNYLEGLGMDILLKAETASIQTDSTGTLKEVILKDARKVPCDVFLLCAGIKPNIDLAEKAGIQVNRGVVVNNRLQTSVEGIYAIGDVAEYEGQIYGLWPIAVEQAETAAINALGGQQNYTPSPPSTILKVVGADVTSVGQIEPQSADEMVIVLEDTESHKYRKLVISQGKIVGTILIGYPIEAPLVTKAIKEGKNIVAVLEDLKKGNWQELSKILD